MNERERNEKILKQNLIRKRMVKAPTVRRKVVMKESSSEIDIKYVTSADSTEK